MLAFQSLTTRLPIWLRQPVKILAGPVLAAVHRHSCHLIHVATWLGGALSLRLLPAATRRQGEKKENGRSRKSVVSYLIPGITAWPDQATRAWEAQSCSAVRNWDATACLSSQAAIGMGVGVGLADAEVAHLINSFYSRSEQGTHSNCIFKFPVFFPVFPPVWLQIFPMPIYVICYYDIHKTDLPDLSSFTKKRDFSVFSLTGIFCSRFPCAVDTLSEAD